MAGGLFGIHRGQHHPVTPPLPHRSLAVVPLIAEVSWQKSGAGRSWEERRMSGACLRSADFQVGLARTIKTNGTTLAQRQLTDTVRPVSMFGVSIAVSAEYILVSEKGSMKRWGGKSQVSSLKSKVGLGCGSWAILDSYAARWC
jgi:hypothetical protein